MWKASREKKEIRGKVSAIIRLEGVRKYFYLIRNQQLRRVWSNPLCLYPDFFKDWSDQTNIYIEVDMYVLEKDYLITFISLKLHKPCLFVIFFSSISTVWVACSLVRIHPVIFASWNIIISIQHFESNFKIPCQNSDLSDILVESIYIVSKYIQGVPKKTPVFLRGLMSLVQRNWLGKVRPVLKTTCS